MVANRCQTDHFVTPESGILADICAPCPAVAERLCRGCCMTEAACQRCVLHSRAYADVGPFAHDADDRVNSKASCPSDRGEKAEKAFAAPGSTCERKR